MAVAQGSQTQLTILEESTYGTPAFATPGDTKILPFISSNINQTSTVLENPTIVADRQPVESKRGNNEVAGDITVAYSHEEYDMLLEGALFGDFTADALVTGTSLKSYTVEMGHLDIGQYRKFTGMVVTSFGLEVTTDGLVQSSFGMMGKTGGISATAQDSAPTAATGNVPFAHFDGTFKEGGSVIGNIISISLNLDNGITSNYALGSRDVYVMTAPSVTVTGTVTAYFENATLLNKFINGTQTALEFTLDDCSGNTHTYLMTNVRYNTASVDVSDGGVLPITLEFSAYKDTVNGRTIKIDRS